MFMNYFITIRQSSLIVTNTNFLPLEILIQYHPTSIFLDEAYMGFH